MERKSVISRLSGRSPRWFFSALVFLLLATGCRGSSVVFQDTASHTSGFVTAAGGVRLHYLDFGGSGKTLLFLAGAGNSAHIFDTFAPRFTDQYHVLALTRRGFGESSQPASSYDQDTLTEDIRQFMDSLGIAKANIAGHSIAGVEMTRFAVTYPDKVEKLVYLDAAFDWATQSENTNLPEIPAQPQPAASDIESLAALAKWQAWIQGVPTYPEADIWASMVFDRRGRLDKSVTPEAVFTAFGTAMAAVHPEYDKVQAPCLALYTMTDSAAGMFPWLTPDSADWQKANTFMAAIQPSMAAIRENFHSKAPNAIVKEIHSVHYLFLAEPDTVENEMRAFLATLP